MFSQNRFFCYSSFYFLLSLRYSCSICGQRLGQFLLPFGLIFCPYPCNHSGKKLHPCNRFLNFFYITNKRLYKIIWSDGCAQSEAHQRFTVDLSTPRALATSTCLKFFSFKSFAFSLLLIAEFPVCCCNILISSLASVT